MRMYCAKCITLQIKSTVEIDFRPVSWTLFVETVKLVVFSQFSHRLLLFVFYCLQRYSVTPICAAMNIQLLFFSLKLSNMQKQQSVFFSPVVTLSCGFAHF